MSMSGNLSGFRPCRRVSGSGARAGAAFSATRRIRERTDSQPERTRGLKPAILIGLISRSYRFRRILIWGVLALVYVVSYFHRIAPAVLAKDLMASFEATGVEVATMAALYLYAFAAMQFVVGAAVDAWGPRRAVAAGAVMMAAGGSVFAARASCPLSATRRNVRSAGCSRTKDGQALPSSGSRAAAAAAGRAHRPDRGRAPMPRPWPSCFPRCPAWARASARLSSRARRCPAPPAGPGVRHPPGGALAAEIRLASAALTGT